MSSPFPHIRRLPRDGTSQRGRRPDALDPASAPLEGRTLAERLDYCRRLGRLLLWYGEDDRPDGTWDRLLGPDEESVQRLADFATDPMRLPTELTAGLAPPHVALLLAVLRLMEPVRERLNRLPARHLDFYQREILKLRPRPAQPDRVHVLAAPAAGSRVARLPKGSLLAAGRDPDGRELVYATQHELAVTRARVAELRSLFAELQLTDPPAVRRDRRRTPGERFLDLLRLALGDPGPGDPLPPRAGWPPVDETLVTDILAGWVDFARSALHLELFELRELVRYKRQRDADGPDWELIEDALNAIGARRTEAPFDLRSRLGNAFDPRAFARNLTEALGREPDFGGLEDVETIDDLYDRRDREEVRRFLRDTQPYDALLDPESREDPPDLAPDFIAMMQCKLSIDAQWAAIVGLLELAGRRSRGDPGFALAGATGFDPTDFEGNLARALPGLDFARLPPIGSRAPVRSIPAYLSVVEEIEAYCFMSAESFRFLIEQALPALETVGGDSARWRRADDILAQARAAKAIAQRRAALARVRMAQSGPRLQLAALLAAALGLPTDERPPLSALVEDAGRRLVSERDLELLVRHADAVSADPPVVPSGPDWQELESVAERVQRARLGVAAAPIERRDWVALHAYADARAVRPTLPTGETQSEGAGTDVRWRTFGEAPARQLQDSPPEPILGWAMASPVLAMRQGRRRVRLALHFDAAHMTDDQRAAIRALVPAQETPGTGPFSVQASGADGWHGADGWPGVAAESLWLETLAVGGASRLKLNLTLAFSESAPAIEASPSALGVPSPWPALRLMPRPVWDPDLRRQTGGEALLGGFRSHYPVLRVLRLAALECSVAVGDPDRTDSGLGLIEPLLRNDRGPLDPGKPFDPFGHAPAVGSRLSVADPELAVKRLDALWIDFDWMGVPMDDLGNWYAGYSKQVELGKESPPGSMNKVLTIQAAILDRNSVRPLGNPVALFGDNATKAHRVKLTQVDDALANAPSALERPAPKDPTRWPRYLRLELTPLDFQHAVFPGEAARAAAATPPLPLNPPYTPRLKSLGIGYTAGTVWPPSGRTVGDTPVALFHLHPFGIGRPPSEPDGTVALLPDYDESGALYIGLEGLAAPQRLTLLFQLAQGSADPDLAPTPVRWSCLDGDRWIDLGQGQVRRDDTRGLIESGTVELDLPEVGPATLMPGGLYWLRLAVDGDPRSLCDTVDVAANAVAAAFVDRDNDPSHYAAPLPAGTIEGPARPIPGIGAIVQPYTSFGGRPAETPEALATRAAERLRHRRRALTAWDYERLALERFPALYKVKCIPAAPDSDSEGLGAVQVIVIPDISRQLPSDPFAPKAPAGLLAEIADYLQAMAAPGARIAVRNADFVPIKVRVGIRFNDGFDLGLARAGLNDALSRWLSPWAYDEGADIVIGGAIYANSIVDFLERQPAVDYVEELKLFRLNAEAGRFEPVARPTGADADGYRVAAAAPDQVLVAARGHEIDPIMPGVGTDERFTGIGYMKIELDFVVAANAAT